MKKLFLAGGVGMLAALLVLTLYLEERPRELVLQGVVDAAEVHVFARTAGRLVEVYTQEGSEVKAGEVLLLLDAPQLRARALQAAAQAQEIERQSGGNRDEPREAFEQWQHAIMHKEAARQHCEHLERLHAVGAVSEREPNEACAIYATAKYNALAASNRYHSIANHAYAADADDPEEATRRMAASLMEIQFYLKNTFLIAPINGQVTAIHYPRGEVAQTLTPLVTITDHSNTWFTFNIHTSLVPYFKRGDIYKINIPTLGSATHKAEITYVARHGAYAPHDYIQRTPIPDPPYYKIHLRPLAPIEGLSPGLPVICMAD